MRRSSIAIVSRANEYTIKKNEKERVKESKREIMRENE
jgi:hypothetical protein